MKIISKKLFKLFFLFLTINLFAEVNSPFVRYPDLNSDGSKIAFSYQGDLWVVSSNGGKAERLTIHEAYDGWPLWSNDDNSIAFSSNRYGNNDLFTIPSNGGIPKRITFHSAGDVLNDFTNDNNLLFTTSRTFRHVEWDHEFATVPVIGGTPELLIDAVGEMPTQSPDGRFIAFVKGWGRVTREAYRGEANNEIWIYDKEKKSYKKVTDFNGHDNYPRWANSRTLYYTSASSGTYNIHKVKIDDNANVIGNDEQITNYTDEGVRFYNISGNGNSVVFERETDIYFMNLSTGVSKKIVIDIASDYRFDPIVYKAFSNKMTEYQISPNGNYTAFVVRGEIFLTENDKEKSKTVNLTNHPFRDQQVTWLNDTTLIFISDRDGQQDLYLVRSADKDQSNLFKSLKHETVRLTNTPEDESFPIVSPDLKKIAYEVGVGTLVIGEVDNNGKISNSTTLLDGWAAPVDVTWSPDTKWLAYSLEDLNFNQEIFIHPVDNHIAPVNVSMHPRYDESPVWSKDGSKLGFTSRRNSSNVLESNDNDVWFVWLNKEDWEKTKDDWDEYEEPKANTKDKKVGDENEEVTPINIDSEDIFERLVQVTSLTGDENNIQFSEDGETIYFTSKSPTKKGRDLFSIKWDGKDIKELTKDGGNPGRVKLSNDGKYLFFSQKGKLNRIDLGKTKKESLPFNAKMNIDFNSEKEQKFDEGWRALRDGFYDPNFHEQNWEELRLKYKPWCLAASTDKDFQDMYNLLLGELNASHMGMRGMKFREDLQKDKTGLLGIRVEPVENGVKVVHVIDNTPASKKQSKIEVGDIITSVNGNNIESNTNLYSLLTNTENEKVLLEVDRNNKVVEVVIRPTSTIKNHLYDEWVEANRKLVDEYSNGKLGYLHIKEMGWSSFERFEREFTARGYGKDGIVIDVRYNGGGWTTDFLMTVLNYKQHAYTIPRGAAKNLLTEKEKFRDYYPIGERLPYSAWTKPSISLCNQNSYSNAEIYSHAYKNLGIGKLVGVPTFGAVISTGSRMLIDGSYVRMPFRGWFVKSDDTNMDFVPAVPDIVVENAPNEKTGENDAQLKRAVEELLKDL
jgi:tricorn protease